MLKEVLEQVQKNLKKASPKNYNDQLVFDIKRKVQPISCGSVIVDRATGVGGLAVRGRLIEISGVESSGKTTLCAQTCAEEQRRILEEKTGESVLYVDYEQAYDFDYGNSLGLRIDGESFAVIQPMNAEEGEKALFEVWEQLGSKLKLVVIDSVAACRTKEMMEEGGGPIGQHAIYWSAFSPKINVLAKKYNTAVLLVNQLRAKPQIGNMDKFKVMSTGVGAGYSSFDNQFNTTGGNTLKFYLSARYLLHQSGEVKEESVDAETGEIEKIRVANWITIKNIKSKISPPFRSVKFVIRYGEGTDDSLPLFNLLKESGIITTKGSYLSYKSHNKKVDFQESSTARFMARFTQDDVFFDALDHLAELQPVSSENASEDDESGDE